MSFSVDLWNGTDVIKKQVFSVLKKIKTISKVISSYLAIETNYHKSLENLYKENKENIYPENNLDKSYVKILDIFDYENKNRKILCDFVNKIVMVPLNEYLRQPNILLNKCFSDSSFNEESFKRTLGLLKDKQTNYYKDCKELAVLLAQSEMEESSNGNDNKFAKTRNSRVKEKLSKLNLSKQEYIDCINESNKEREKYNKKTEEILNTIEQQYMTMLEKFKYTLVNFAEQRNELLYKLYKKEKNEYENLHTKIDLDEELFYFIQNNATKEFPRRKFEFCPLKYNIINQNIKNKCNKFPENALSKIYKNVKEFFENNKIFKEEISNRVTRRNTEFFNFFSSKKILLKDSKEINNNEEKESKEFIENYINDLFINNFSNNNKSQKNLDNKDENKNINIEEKPQENNQHKDDNNQKENNNIDIKIEKKETDIKNEEKEEKEENNSNNKNQEIINNKQEIGEKKEKCTDNNIIFDDNKSEIKTCIENIDKNEINSNNNCTLDNTTPNENKNEEKTDNEQESKEENKDQKILTYFYQENPNFAKNVEILIKKLSFLRSKGYFNISEKAYNRILSLFFIILNDESKNDYILKNILILSQTFYKKVDNKKIYLQQGMKGKKIFSDPETWHKVINYSMNLSCSSMDLSQTKEDMIEKINKEAAAIVLAYLCDIKQYTDNEDVFNKVKNYYVKVYNLDENMINKEVEKFFVNLNQKENIKNNINLNDLDDENFIKPRYYSISPNILKINDKTITNNEIKDGTNQNINENNIENKEEDNNKNTLNNGINKEIENENKGIINNNIIENKENKSPIINNNINIIKIQAKEVIIVENSNDKINIEQIKAIKKEENDNNIIKVENIKKDENKEIKITNDIIKEENIKEDENKEIKNTNDIKKEENIKEDENKKIKNTNDIIKEDETKEIKITNDLIKEENIKEEENKEIKSTNDIIKEENLKEDKTKEIKTTNNNDIIGNTNELEDK